MAENKMLEYALWYAELGIPVFPVKARDKRPLTAHGCRDATTNTERIEKWWGNWPNANIGIATGVGDRPLCVLDVDIGHGSGKQGDETLRELEAQYEKLPNTWVCRTGGGGLHYYFVCDDPSVTIGADVLPGLDFRGRGGYVIAPPSVHKSERRYAWSAGSNPEKGVQLAEIPMWLLGLLRRGKQSTAEPRADDKADIIPEGSRNTEIFRMASSLRARGLTVEEITAAMMQINEDRCTPPLSEDEVKTICQSVGNYERGTATRRDWGNESVKPPDFSDAGNAEVFTRVYRNDLIFTDSMGWLCWDGMKWQRDDHRASTYALELSARMLREALNENRAALHKHAEAQARFAETEDPADGELVKKADLEKKAAKAFLTHAQNLRGAGRIRNMLGLSKQALVIKADRLDANPTELNTPDGIVDLTTGAIRPHDRTAYCSQMTAVGPSGEGSSIWADFLDTISCGDHSVQMFLQNVAGMALLGAVYQEGIVIAYGGGRNGKSTFFNTLGAVVGDYTGSIEINTLTTERGNKGAQLATLRGKRLAITGELEEHQRLSVATLKRIASTDRLVVEEKYKQPETVKQTHTLVLFTNHLPRVGSTDNGTWRRLTVVPFNASIPPGEGVQNYADVLVDKAGGAVMSWAIEGAVNFVRNGYKLDIPAVVAAATSEYREREDWLKNFIEDRCERKPGARVGARDLYLAYKGWAEDAGEYIRRENDFAVAMETAGYQRRRTKNGKMYEGLRVDEAAVYGFSNEVTAGYG